MEHPRDRLAKFGEFYGLYSGKIKTAITEGYNQLARQLLGDLVRDLEGMDLHDLGPYRTPLFNSYRDVAKSQAKRLMTQIRDGEQNLADSPHAVTLEKILKSAAKANADDNKDGRQRFIDSLVRMREPIKPTKTSIFGKIRNFAASYFI